MNDVLQEYRKRPHWSFSSLNQLLNICSLQWYFQKVAKIVPPFVSVNLVMGSAYHRTLEQVFLCKKVEMPFTALHLQNQVRLRYASSTSYRFVAARFALFRWSSPSPPLPATQLRFGLTPLERGVIDLFQSIGFDGFAGQKKGANFSISA